MIGKMNHRITFQLLTIVPQPGGGGSEEWTDELTTWAKVSPLRSGRQLQDNQVSLVDGYKFIVRWAKDRTIDKKRRIKYENKIMTINSVVEIDESKRYYEITAIHAS